MFKIDRNTNAITPLEQKSFSSLGFREREHLQEWIAKHPSSLGEDLLIIQKEFSGFDKTQERLDLLALDKQGSLVVIENKLDDSGRDVVWQSLKYASYCSGLSVANIKAIYQDYLNAVSPGSNAEENISDFLEVQDFEDVALNKGVTQRIIMIAANFRNEVTSTALWLLNFNVRIQCMKVTPFAMGDDLFLNIEQIIPTKDAEEYMIGMAEKAQDDVTSAKEEKTRHHIRREFWAKLIPAMNASCSNLYQNISPSAYNWIGAGSGIRGVGFNFSISKTYARAELYIDTGEQNANKIIFDTLFSQRADIENVYGGALEWERLDEKRASRVKAEQPANVFDRDQWDEMIAFMVDAMCRLEKAIHKPLKAANDKLKDSNTLLNRITNLDN